MTAGARRAVSVNQHAAIDVDHRARDVGGQVGGKEQIGAGHVVGVAEAVERDALDDLRPHLVGQLAAGDVGLDQAGRHAVDADAVRARVRAPSPSRAQARPLWRRE